MLCKSFCIKPQIFIGSKVNISIYKQIVKANSAKYVKAELHSLSLWLEKATVPLSKTVSQAGFEILPSLRESDLLLTSYDRKQDNIFWNIQILQIKASYRPFHILKLETDSEQLSWGQGVQHPQNEALFCLLAYVKIGKVAFRGFFLWPLLDLESKISDFGTSHAPMAAGPTLHTPWHTRFYLSLCVFLG